MLYQFFKKNFILKNISITKFRKSSKICFQFKIFVAKFVCKTVRYFFVNLNYLSQKIYKKVKFCIYRRSILLCHTKNKVYIMKNNIIQLFFKF